MNFLYYSLLLFVACTSPQLKSDPLLSPRCEADIEAILEKDPECRSKFQGGGSLLFYAITLSVSPQLFSRLLGVCDVKETFQSIDTNRAVLRKKKLYQGIMKRRKSTTSSLSFKTNKHQSSEKIKFELPTSSKESTSQKLFVEPLNFEITSRANSPFKEAPRSHKLRIPTPRSLSNEHTKKKKSLKSRSTNLQELVTISQPQRNEHPLLIPNDFLELKPALGSLPLHWALQNNEGEMVFQILNTTEDPQLSFQDGNGNTPLHIAAEHCSERTIKILLKGPLSGEDQKKYQNDFLFALSLHNKENKYPEHRLFAKHKKQLQSKSQKKKHCVRKRPKKSLAHKN